ncbi:hypothetical protein ACLB2K_065190 [Fragaria x ananassa]
MSMEVGGAKVYREHVMWHGTITRALEAWCRVPQSPREGRLVVERCGPLRGESVCAWLAKLTLLSVAGRCAGESVCAWLERLWLLCVAAAAWRVSPRLVGETVAMWLVSSRLAGDSHYCALRPLRGDRYVASQSALGWGDSLLSVAGRCPSESVRAWLGTVAMWRVNARLIGNCRYVALRPLRGESVRAWLGRLVIECCGPLPW